VNAGRKKWNIFVIQFTNNSISSVTASLWTWYEKKKERKIIIFSCNLGDDKQQAKPAENKRNISINSLIDIHNNNVRAEINFSWLEWWKHTTKKTRLLMLRKNNLIFASSISERKLCIINIPIYYLRIAEPSIRVSSTCETTEKFLLANCWWADET
jgi:hypothetical protein